MRSSAIHDPRPASSEASVARPADYGVPLRKLFELTGPGYVQGAALAVKLRPALVLYAHQHRPHVSAAAQPALVGLGSFRDGQSSAVVLESTETRRLVRALRDRQAAAQLEAAGTAR